MEPEPEKYREQERGDEKEKQEPSPVENTGWLPPLSNGRVSENFTGQAAPEFPETEMDANVSPVSPKQPPQEGTPSILNDSRDSQAKEKASAPVPPAGYCPPPFTVPPYQPPHYFSPASPSFFYGQPSFTDPGGMPYPRGQYGKEDLSKPLSVLCSRDLTEQEFYKMQKILGYRTAKPVVGYGILLLVLILINLVSVRRQADLGIVLLSSLISAAAFLVFAGILAVGHKRKMRRRYLQQKNLFSGESVVEIYPDRIVKISRTKRFILPFRKVHLFSESPEMFLLADEFGRTVVLRAGDMIPFDVRKAREIFYARLPAAKKQVKDFMVGELAEPLPIPVIQKKEDVLFSFPLEIKEKQRQKGENSEQLFRLPLLIAFGIAFGTQFANIFWITKSFTADILIYSGILTGALAILFAAILGILKIRELRRAIPNDRPSGIVLTGQELTLCIADYAVALPWNRILASEKTEGLLLEVLDHRQALSLFLIKWGQIPDRTAFLQCIREHGSFREETKGRKNG